MTKLKVLGQQFYLKILRAPRFKKPWTIMPLLPWDKAVLHLGGLRAAQSRAVDAFIKFGHATAHLSLADRMEIARKVLSGKGRYGGKARPAPYPRLSPEELRRKIEEVKAALAAAGVA